MSAMYEAINLLSVWIMERFTKLPTNTKPTYIMRIKGIPIVYDSTLVGSDIEIHLSGRAFYALERQIANENQLSGR